MRVTLIRTCVVTLLLLHAGTAWATSATGLRTVMHNCQSAGIDPDAKIEACSELIHSNLMTSHVVSATFANRGNAYAEKSDLDDAMKDYDKALELNPGFLDARLDRAAVFLRLRRYPEALSDYDAAIDADKTLWRAWYGRGVCKLHAGDAAGSKADFAQANALNPKAADQFPKMGS